MSISTSTKSPRSRGQWAVTIIFGLLSVAFLFRFVQFAWKWLGHTVDGDKNFKALTIWALVYVIVCAAVSAVAYCMPREDDAPSSEPSH